MAYFFGIHAVYTRLTLSSGGVCCLLLKTGKLSPRLQAMLALAKPLGCPVKRIDSDDFAHLTTINHQGVGLEVEAIQVFDEILLAQLIAHQEEVLLLVLDGVTDPRNLGACLRSAAASGVTAVILPKNRCAPLNEAAIKTASGGASYVPVIQVVNLARCLRQLQQSGVWVAGTLLDAEQTIDEVDLKGNMAIVMGAEDRGLRDKTSKICDFLVKIPMQNSQLGFNVSVATGICLYEATRQRRS